MADLKDIIPTFDLQPWRHLTYSLQKRNVSTAELVSQHPVDIARKCPLPLREVKRLVAVVIAALRQDVASNRLTQLSAPQSEDTEPPKKKLRVEHTDSFEATSLFVKTLDRNIDHCLGGGFPTRSVCEIVGESAVGKTQFVLSLLLSAQMPPPKGVGRATLYLSTEDRLNTSRLHQILQNNPEYQDLPKAIRPTLDRVFTMSTCNFDLQESIVNFKLPYLVQENNIGLVVLDSVAANFRTQFPGVTPAVLSDRARALIKLGKVLRQIAYKHNVAVVITNQVSDRFDNARIDPDKFRFASSAPPSSATTMPGSQVQHVQTSMGPPPPRSTLTMSQAERDEVMRLDYQQCFFTGWGDDPNKPFEALKTPALGLIWANQIDARVVLKIAQEIRTTTTENLYSDHKRRRHLSVVFAPWVAPTNMPVEYELCMQGPVSIPLSNGEAYVQADDLNEDDESDAAQDEADEIQEMLDPKYWENDLDENGEFV